MCSVGQCSTPSSGLQWTCQTYQRQYGPPQQADHPCRTLKTHPSYQCTILGMKRRSPTKPKLPDLLETSPNRSLTLTSLTTSLAKILPSPNRTTTTPALPRARAQLPNRRSPLLPTFLQNSGKTESYAPHHA